MSYSDLLGDAETLRQALDRPELDFFDDNPDNWKDEVPEQSRRAAVDLAVALGKCRLHGVELGEDDGTLSFAMAKAAVDQLVIGTAELIESAEKLGERYDNTYDPVEIHDHVTFLIEDRIDSWAAFIAIDDAYGAELEKNDSDDAMPTKLMPLISLIEKYDDVLMKNMDILTIIDDRVIEKWKSSLRADFAEFLPWFLDGRIEKRREVLEAQTTSAVILKDMRKRLGFRDPK